MLNLKNKSQPLTVRRRVDGKVFRFSLVIGGVGLFLAGVLYAAAFYPSMRRWQRINERALAAIKCGDVQCNTTDFASSWEVDPDYIVDVRDRYLIWVPSSSNEESEYYAPLDLADTGFIRTYREPASYQTPDGEIWRLFSRQAQLRGRSVEVLVGHTEKGPTNMLDTPQSALPEVDAKLKKVAERIAEGLDRKGDVGSPSKLVVDGFEVVASDDGTVLYHGPWVPSFLPHDRPLPTPGTKLYRNGSEVFVEQTNRAGPLLATSLVPVANLFWLLTLAVLAFVAFVWAARWGARRFLRNHFALSNARLPELKEAIEEGEGQGIEFKRALAADESNVRESDTEVLRSVTAFANTNDGVIFIGVNDRGTVTGLRLDYKQRDVFSQRMRSLVQSHIRPIPPVQYSFEAVKELVVARIAVARGAEFVYALNGLVYVRDGSSDVLARAEDYKRMFAEA